MVRVENIARLWAENVDVVCKVDNRFLNCFLFDLLFSSLTPFGTP